MTRNNDYTTENLSRQTNTTIPEQINFTGELQEVNAATMIFIAEKQHSLIVTQ